MAKYTVELGTLLENEFDIGLKSYPIFDERYREGLNQKIIDHYWFREIGFETAELFKRMLNRTMNEIMPYYNQLYESEKLKFDPFENVNKTEKMERDVTNDGKFNTDTTGKDVADDTSHVESESNDDITTTGKTTEHGTDKTTGKVVTDNHNKDVSSDTPQGLLNVGSVNADTWATNAVLGESENTVTYDKDGIPYTVTHDSNGTSESHTIGKNTAESNGSNHHEGNTEGNSNGTTNSTTDEDVTRTVKGKEAGETYSEMLIKFRETFLNIDMMIIDDLKTLFMTVY